MPTAKNIFLRWLMVCLFMTFSYTLFAQESGDDEQVRIEAEKLFAQKKYTEAFPLYSQLLSIHRKDPFYSYRFGVCLLYSDRRDPEEPLRYMEPSVGNLTGDDATMIYFHLGVAYHQAYRFGEAVRALTAFKAKISPKNPYYKETEIRFAMCENGISLLQNLSDLTVLKRYEVNLESFYRSYDVSKFGGNIGPKPEFLKTKPDRASTDPELIFFSDTHQVVYYSSYGKKDITGRDLYRVYKLPGGKWSTPEKLSNAVNTQYDENYPYLLPDGKTLYFCSKGHNSMGGYDVFRTVFDSSKGDWTKPVNIDFAINTPFDDILFITDPSQRYAWFSSFRNSSDGRIMVFLVRIDRKVPDYDDYRPDMIAATDVDVNSEEYLKSVEKLREKAQLNVNSNEEMQLDTPKVLVSAEDNKRYNIPANPTDNQIVDLAFFHVNAAEKEMYNFRNMRDNSLKVSDSKKSQAEALNKKSQDLYDKALTETDSKARKELMAQATDLSKQSEQLLDESQLAKKMYDQYLTAGDEQAKTLDRLQEQAGYVQQLALSRQLDTSVTVLKKLIDNVDTFKIQLVTLDKKIKGDSDYMTDLEQNIAGNYTDSKKLNQEAAQIDKQAEAYTQEANLATDPELKQEYQDEANNLKKEADAKRNEALRLQNEAKNQEKELVDLKSNTQLRNNIVNDALALNTDSNNVAVNGNNTNNGNNDIANNNGNNDVNNNNGNNTNNANNTNGNNTNGNNDVNNNNGNNGNNTNNNNTNGNNTNGNNDVANNSNNTNNGNNTNNNNTNGNNTNGNNNDVANNSNNSNNGNNTNNSNGNNDVSNNANDTNKTNNGNQNNTVTASANDRVNAINKEVLDNLTHDRDSVSQALKLNNQQKDAIALSYAQKQSQYNSKLSEWNRLKQKTSPTQTEQVKQSELEAELKDLNLQMNVLSDLYNETDRENSSLVQATNKLEGLVQNATDAGTATDTIALRNLQQQANDVVAALTENPSDNNAFALKSDDIRSTIKDNEQRRNEWSSEVAKYQKQLDNQLEKYGKTNSESKKEKISADVELTREKLGEAEKQVTDLSSSIIQLNDSLIYLEKRNSQLAEARESYNKIPEAELKQLSNEYKTLGTKPNLNDVATLPDFNATNGTASNNNQLPNNTGVEPKDSIAGSNTLNLLYTYGGQTLQDINKNVGDEDVQDLVQSSYFGFGSEVFMVRIATLKRKLEENPADSNLIKSEIDMLTKTMNAYQNEANAYESNANNNFRLSGKTPPDEIPMPQPELMASYHMQQYAADLLRADSVRRLAEQATDPQLKNRYEQQASAYIESSRRHYLMGSDIYGIWDNSQYESNNVLLSENKAADPNAEKARQLMMQARQLRSEAFRTNDFEKQQDLLNQARKAEQDALALQKNSLTTAGIDSPEKMMSKTVSEIENSSGMTLDKLAPAYLKNANVIAAYTGNPADTATGVVAVNNNNGNNTNNNGNNTNNNTNNTNNNNTNNTTNGNNNTNNNNTTNNTNTTNNGNNANNNTNNTVANNTTNNTNATNNAANNTTANNSTPVTGLYYRVQVAASRQMVDTNAVFGALPVVTEQSGGWFQFMTGYFTTYNPANAERLRVRPMGYADAFVVAYFNGKRIPVYEARRMEQGGAVAQNTGNTNLNAANVNPTNTNAPAGNFAMTDVDGLVYSVQVGVYAKTRNSTTLFGISPLIEERMANGYYRYFAGTFANMNDAVTARNTVRANGVPDAFVVILYKGKKITQVEADKLLAEGSTFGGGLKQGTAANNNTTPERNGANNNATPASKPIFKVQIGAYSKDVPVDVVNKLIEIAGEGIETSKSETGMTIYSAGKFNSYAEAESLKTELVGKGLVDAFVVAFVDGKRVSVSEARGAE